MRIHRRKSKRLYEQPAPKLARNPCATSERVELVCDPDDEYDVEGGGRVVKELGHDRFDADQRQNHCQQRRCGEGH